MRRGKKRPTKKDVVIYCGSCESRCIVKVDIGLSEEEVDKVKYDSFYVCQECTPLVEKLEKEEGLYYFQSHITEGVVYYSSHKEIQVSKYLIENKPQAPQTDESDSIRKALELLLAADAIVILVGAGMSADSNIATFRPNKVRGCPAEEKHEVAENFMRNVSLEEACYKTKPEKAWFYDAGYREVILQSVPHPGYGMLRQILDHLQKPFFVVTTNIDRYFAKSGFPGDLLYEAHGSVEALQCSKIGTNRCNGVWLWPDESPLPILHKKEATCDISTVPKCIHCGCMARCNISHFPDDPADVDTSIKKVQRSNFREWIKSVRKEVTACGINVQKRKMRKKDSLESEDLPNGKVLILEIGSGESNHGLRAESELLLSAHPEVGFGENSTFIRINPDAGTSPMHSKDGHIQNASFVRLGAQHAFDVLLPLVLNS